VLSLLAAFALGVSTPAAAVTQVAVSSPTAAPAPEALGDVLAVLNRLAPDDERVAQLERLAARRDASLVPVFEALVRDPLTALRAGAVVALAAISAPTATDALANVARRSDEALAGAALDGLGRQQTRAAAAALFGLQQDGFLRAARRQKAADILAAAYAQYREEYPPRPPPDRVGLLPLVVVSGEVGALSLSALGHLGKNPNLGVTLGAWSGAALGLSAGYLWKRDEPYSAVRGWRAASYTNWGLAGTTRLASQWLRENNTDGHLNEGKVENSAAALGALAGFGAAELDRQELPLDQQALVDLGGLGGLALGRAFVFWDAGLSGYTAAAAAADGGALAGLAVSRALLSRFRLTPHDQMLLFSGPLLGVAWAPLTAVALEPGAPDHRLAGWALAGLGGGYLASLGLAAGLEVPSETVFTADVAALYGSAAGLGVALVAVPIQPGLTRKLSIPLLAGGVAGFGVGLGTAERLHLVPPAQLLLLAGSVVGGWQGAGWASYARYRNARENEVQGWALLGLAGGAGLALGYSQAATVTAPMATALLVGVAGGTWYAGLGADVLDAGQRDTLLACLVGTDAGIALVGALIGPLGVDPLRVTWGGVFGAIGAGVAATGAGFATAGRRDIEAAALAGTTVGLAAGAWLAPMLRLPAPRLEVPVTLIGVQPFVADGRAKGLTVTLQVD
jgi:hypothetical protein